ncbi:MAG TPA: hypothetical protein VKS24_25080 [Bradyrhizobium sp.]|nr:hypothetical protein [Bradyrhizobium sp.]
MARTLFTPYPETTPTLTPPQDYQHVDTSPAAFGALQGQALEHAGAQLAQTGNELTNTYSELSAQQANSGFTDKVNKILFGDPDTPGDVGYYGMHGQAAMDNRGATLKAIEDARQQALGGLSTTQAQVMFSNEARYYTARITAEIGRHYDDESKVWAGTVQKTRYSDALNDAALRGWQDPNALLTAEGQAASALMQADQSVGILPPSGQPTTPEQDAIILAHEHQAKVDTVEAAIKSALGRNQPGIAQSLFDSNKDVLSASKNFDELARQLKTSGNAAIGMGMLNDAQGRAGSASTQQSAPAVSSNAVNTSIPPEGRALLDTLAGPESGGAYNVRWNGSRGDATFSSYADHPRVYAPGPQGPSSAAGRYQIVASTWDKVAPEIGATDFSPPNQDAAAWQIAQDAYKQQTGGDLLTALRQGQTASVQSALRNSNQWTTANMSSYGANLAKYQNATAGQTGAGTQAQPIPTALPPGQPQTPPVAQPPSIEGLSLAQSELAQRHAATIQHLIDDPRAQTNPEALQHAIAVEDTQFRAKDAALALQKQAITEQQGLVADNIVKRLMAGDSGPDMVNQIAAAEVSEPVRAHLWALLDEHNKNTPDAGLRDFGPGYYDVVKRMGLKPDDPNRISDYSQLLAMTVPDQTGFRWLSENGLKQASLDLASTKKPESAADLQVKAAQLEAVKHFLAFEDDGTNKLDPVGMASFARFMPVFQKYWDSPQRLIDQGKGDPTKGDSPMTNAIYALAMPYKRSAAEFQKDFMTAPQPAPEVKIETQDDLAKAISNGTLTKAQGQQIGIERGWIVPRAATPPAPAAPAEPQAPMR